MPILTTLGAACAKAWGFTSGLAKDQYFNLVSLLLPGNGTNGTNNNFFLDSSTNNFPITRNPTSGPNAPTQGTFSPFSQTGWGNYFDGVTDYVTVADAAALEPGSGDMTFETWIYPTASGQAGGSCIISKSVSGSFGPFNFQQTSTNTLNLLLSTGGTTWDASFATTATVNINQWNHVAFTRSGNTFTIWINGASGATNTSITTGLVNNSQPLMFGWGNSGTTTLFQGYMSNARYVIGRAVYTSAFTPPTAPLGTTSGGQNPPTGTQTALLTFQSNRFLDNSVNTFAVTKNGDVAIVAFSPFAPTAAYTTAAVGGSGYFDGTGDYLEAATNAAFSLASTAFTIEAWVYFNATSLRTIMTTYGSGTTGWTLQTNSSSVMTFNASGDGADITGTKTLTTGQWYHVAVSGTAGSSIKMFINGEQDGSTYTGNITDSSSSLIIAQIVGINFVNGYISGLRIVKGTAVYTSNFTPPTSPPTAITNTSLLLNFTNAGITDATAKNDLETVGNAQISTSVSKFGGGSIAFDGSGDYCVTSPSAVNDLSTGNWTIEFWVYPTTAASQQTLVNLGASASNYNGTNIFMNTSRQLVVDNTVTGQPAFSGGTLTLNTWNHVAITRVSTTTTGYINGVSVGTNSYIPNANQVVCLGYLIATGYAFNGYIDDFRITKGYARYTGNFTPPTAPFPVQ